MRNTALVLLWILVTSAAAFAGQPVPGIGKCPAGQVVSALNASAPPTCVTSSGLAPSIFSASSITGTPWTFSKLTNPAFVGQTDGTLAYCCNCISGSSPCVSDGGTVCSAAVALAFHHNGAWDCSLGTCKIDLFLVSGLATFTAPCVTVNSVCTARDKTLRTNAVTLGIPGAGSVAVAGTGTDEILVVCQ